MSIEEMIEAIYNEEVNIMIESFWDAGYSFHIGDEVSGFIDRFESMDFRSGVKWLYDQIVVTKMRRNVSS